MFFESMHPAWQALLADQKPVLEAIETRILQYQNAHDAAALAVTPPLPMAMRAFEVEPAEIRVLLVGQDPYPTEGHAVGLSFAVSAECRPLPRSLQNMMKELASDLPAVTSGGDLLRWRNQGVMLLNRHLTTVVGHAAAHEKLGWSEFTDAAVASLAKLQGKRLVALLWGRQAQQLEPLLGGCNVLPAAHPSPLSASRGFLGSKPFSKANAALQANGAKTIDWSC